MEIEMQSKKQVVCQTVAKKQIKYNLWKKTSEKNTKNTQKLKTKNSKKVT